MGFAPIHVAVQCDLPYAAELLQDGGSYPPPEGWLNYEDSFDATPLHWAAGANSVDGVSLLLNAGAEVGWVNASGHTPLSLTAQEGHPQSMKLLLDHGADVDSLDGRSANCCTGEKSALLIACFNGEVACVRLLLEAGASVEVMNALGYTPMAIACLLGHLPVAQLLSAFGAQRRFQLFEELAIFDAGTNGPKIALALCPETIGRLSETELSRRPGFTMVDTAAAAAKAAEVDATFRQPSPPQFVTADEVAEAKGHGELAAWLRESRGWQPLHHLAPLAQTASRSAHRASLLPHMPAMNALHAQLTASASASAAASWELPSKELLEAALKACPPSRDNMLARYEEAADDSLDDRELELLSGYDLSYAPADKTRRKRVFISNMLQTCLRFMNACSPLGDQLSAEAATSLLDAGADVSAAAADGCTPLSRAQAMSAASSIEPGSAADLVLRHQHSAA
jgi:hypothetical protein